MSKKIPVEAMDHSEKNSSVAGPIEEESTVLLDQASKVCYWNDREFTEGQVVTSEGSAYECTFGQWIKEG